MPFHDTSQAPRATLSVIEGRWADGVGTRAGCRALVSGIGEFYRDQRRRKSARQLELIYLQGRLYVS